MIHLQSPWCLAQAAPLVGRSMGQTVPSPTDSCPCWRRRSTGQTLRSGSQASPCRPQRGPSWCLGRVCATAVLQDLCLPFLAELSPTLWKRGCEWRQWGNTRELTWGLEGPAPFSGSTNTFDPAPQFFSLSLSYSQRSSCSQCPYLQPHHGWG